MKSNQGVFIPRDLINNEFIMFHFDNADFREDARDTTHVLLLVGFQKKANVKTPEIVVDLNSRSMLLQENNFGELVPYTKPAVKRFLLEDVHKGFVSNHYQNISKEYFTSTTVVWQLSKSLEIMLNEKVSMLQGGYERIASTIPNEEDLLIEVEEDSSTMTEEHGGIQYLHGAHITPCRMNDDIRFLTNTLFFPLIPAPSSNFSAVFTALKASQSITEFANGVDSKTVVTLDLDLYERAVQIVHSNHEMRNKIILRLGALHIVFAHIRAIGHYIEGYGLDNSWEIADRFGSRTVFSVLNCGQGAMKKAITTHEITLTALYSIYHKALIHQKPELITEDIINTVSNTLNNSENTKANHDKYQKYSNQKTLQEKQRILNLRYWNLHLDISVHEDG